MQKPRTQELGNFFEMQFLDRDVGSSGFFYRTKKRSMTVENSLYRTKGLQYLPVEDGRYSRATIFVEVIFSFWISPPSGSDFFWRRIVSVYERVRNIRSREQEINIQRIARFRRWPRDC